MISLRPLHPHTHTHSRLRKALSFLLTISHQRFCFFYWTSSLTHSPTTRSANYPKSFHMRLPSHWGPCLAFLPRCQGTPQLVVSSGGALYQPVTMVTSQGQVVTQAIPQGAIQIQNTQVSVCRCVHLCMDNRRHL